MRRYRPRAYDGPIDGWFSIYHRAILPVVLSLQMTRYCFIGAAVRRTLIRRRQRGLLCTRMKVFHAIGPAYASLFGMLDFEIAKYRALGRTDIVNWYSTTPATPRAEMQSSIRGRDRGAGLQRYDGDGSHAHTDRSH